MVITPVFKVSTELRSAVRSPKPSAESSTWTITSADKELALKSSKVTIPMKVPITELVARLTII